MEARGLAGDGVPLPSRKQSSPEGSLPRPWPQKEGRPRLLRETLAAATLADQLPPRGCRAPRPDPGLERGAPGCRRPRAPWGPGGHRTPTLRLCSPPPRPRRSTRGTFLPRLQPAPPNASGGATRASGAVLAPPPPIPPRRGRDYPRGEAGGWWGAEAVGLRVADLLGPLTAPGGGGHSALERNGGLRRWTPGCGPSRERVEDPAAHLPADRVTGLT